MKVAVATDDKVNIANHFGRALGFVIFEIDENKVINQEYRENIGKHQEDCGSCDHDTMINNLSDCQVIISYGMGRRIFADLTKNNIQAVVTDEKTVKDAISKFINNDLRNRLDRLH
ncbi:MAG: hypothetical protein BV457_00745 [Thermoplasmata archaeon M9B1D]|nr:MAG: hypothetical protein BV456_09850 [Thermoplasmata archaeon M8B2D]PNX49705.1 MAG: hypothetical protein BV457_00745 [Thermoplasmata archaeon M9B1D]